MRKTRKDKKKVKKVIKNIFFRLLILLVLGGICLLLFFLCQGFKKSVWDGKNNINLVIQMERTFIYTFHPDDEILNIISLPNDLYLETAREYGEYKLKNIYQLGEVEKVGGGELLRMSLQNLFVVPIDGYIVKTPKIQSASWRTKSQSENLEKGRLTSLYFCLLTRNYETNLSGWDLIRVFNHLNKLKFNNINLVKIEETILFKKEELADGSEVFRLETLQIDDFSQKQFTDKHFLNEGLKLSVFNATNYSGLAKNASRLLKNIGGEIVSSKDEDQTFERSILYYNNEEQKKTYSFKKIRQIFQIEEVLLDSEIEGDVRLVLGRDYLERYYLK